MSNTIDQRVVEMRFDNKHFEQNVSTTMSTLDKLKQKLRLDGASKGLDNVNNATKNLKMDGVSSAVDTVTARFSALEVMGVTALANITNSAVNAGKRMIKALTIDPITTGFKEYETQINATQTILANTRSKGSTIDDVNRALEELNKYADLTIYNFTEMTRNIGTFTAAGIDLDTSVAAIQGIANLAAVSGSTSQQASTAMYQLSQALSTGTVRLMDWNSVVNAGMGGEMFQNALRETSELLGTGAEAAIDASGSFRESLKDGWLTSEVLTETLKKFTTSGAKEYVAEYTGLSAEAVDAALEAAKATYGEADAIKYASQALAEKSGKNADEIAAALEFAQNAEDAATKVKTFTQLWDVLKEAAQSGWSQTWKIIIGDFEEAKSLLTPLSEFLTGMINKMSEWRNAVLESALGKGFTHLTEQLSGLLDPAANAIATVKDSVDALVGLGDIVNDVIMGKFGNGIERYDALTEAGINYYEVQNKVNEKLGDSFRYTEEEIAAQSKLIGTQQELAESTEKESKAITKLTDEQKEQLKMFARMNPIQAKNKGYTDEQIKAMQELVETAKKLGLPMDEFIDNIDQINGRWLLINSFKNIGQGIVNVFNAMKTAWQDIFPPKSIEERGEQLFNLIAAFHKFTSILEGNSETARNFHRTFKGVFALLDIVRMVVGGPLKIAFDAFIHILSLFDLNILDVTAAIGDAIVEFRDWIKAALDFSKILDPIVYGITVIVEAWHSWISGLKDSENLPKDIADGIAKGFETIFRVVGDFFKNIPDFFKNGFAEIGESPISGIIDSIRNGLQIAGQVVTELGKIILEKLNSFLNAKGFEEISADAIAGLVNGLRDGASEVWASALELGKQVLQAVCDFLGIESPSKEMEAVGGHTIDGFVLGIQNGSSKIWEVITGLFGKVVEWIKNLDFGTVLASVIGIATVKAGSAFVNFSKPFAGVGEVLESTTGILEELAIPVAKVVKGFAKIERAAAFNLRMDGVKTLATALLMLVAAIVVLTFIEIDKLWDAVKVVGALSLILVALSFVLSKLSASTMSFNFKNGLNVTSIMSSLIGIGVAILLIGATAKLISTIDPDQAEIAFAGLRKIIASILMVAITFGVISKLGGGKNINDFGRMMTKMSVALLLMVAVIKLATLLDESELAAGTAFIANFAGFVLALNLIALLPSKNINLLGGMMIKMSIALLLMVAVVKLASKLDESEISAAADFLKMFVMFVGGLALVSLIGGTAIKGLGGMLLGVSTAMLILLGVVKLAGQLSPEEISQGMFVVRQFGAMITMMIILTSMFGSQAPKVAGTILAFGVAIGLLAAVAIVLGHIDLEALAKGIVAVGLLGAVIAGVVVASRGAVDVKGTMIGIAVAIGVMAAAIALLTLVDPTKLAITTGLMSILLGMFALIVRQSFGVEKAMGTIIAIAGTIAIIGGILYLLSGLPVESVIGSAIALGGIMLVMTGVLAALGTIGKFAKDGIKGAIALAALSVPLALFGLVLAMMSALKVDNALPNVLALTILCAALTALLIPLSVIGLLVTASGGTILLGVAALLAMAVPMVAFVGIIALMSGIQNGVTNAKALTSLMTAMSDMLFKISIIAPLAIMGVGVLGAMLGLIMTLGVVVTAIGALVTKFPQLQEFIDTGIPILERLASGLGSIIGSFISGFAGEVMNILPQLGTCLSQFMDNATAFIVGAKTVDESVLTGVGILSAAVLALTAADLITGVASFMQGGSSFADLGTQLSQFMLNALPFIAVAATLTPDMLTGVKALADTILLLTAADILQSLTSFITGGASLETFASQLPLLGNGIAAFSSSLGEFSEDQLATVNCAAEAIKILAQASSTIPNAGGLLGQLVGENDLGVFASQFPVLGSGLRGFLDSIGVFSEDQVATVNCAAEAIKILAQASSEIPNAGGLLGQLVGENDLAAFASQFPVLGSGLRGFLDNVGEFTDAQVATVNCAADAISSLAKASSNIPNSGGWLAQLVGENDLSTFANQFPALGTGLRGFLDNVGILDDTANGTITAGANAVSALATAASKIPSEGGWISKLIGDNDLATFAANFPKLGEGLSGFVSKLGTFSEAQVTTVDAAVRAINALSGLANSNLSSASTYLTSFSNDLPPFAEDFASFCSTMPAHSTVVLVVSTIDKLLEAVESISNANSGCLATFADDLKTVGKNAVNKFIEAFTSGTAKSDLKDAAKKLADKAADGIEDKESDIKSAAKKAAKKAVDGVETQKDEMYYAGRDLGSGLVSGIESKETAAYNAGYALGQAAVQGEKDGQQSNSPSKLTILAGQWLGEGLVIGMGKMSRQVYSAGSSLGRTATGTISSAVSRVAELVNTDIDSQPTIRPVLDLSDVRAGANMIGGLLGAGGPIGVQANVSAISSMMSSRSQNGVNADVVSAIDKLNKKMDNLGNTTYSIAGVTYDDGSNIAEAVRTITRAAVRERRI